MRIRATCDACGKDFLFFQLYNTDARFDSRCPHCNCDLGFAGARHHALLADRAAVGLVEALRGISDSKPNFTVKAEHLLDCIGDAVHELPTQVTGRDDETERPSRERCRHEAA